MPNWTGPNHIHAYLPWDGPATSELWEAQAIPQPSLDVTVRDVVVRAGKVQYLSSLSYTPTLHF